MLATLANADNTMTKCARKGYFFYKTPEQFMLNDVWNYAIMNLLSDIETAEMVENDVNMLCDRLCKTLVNEMDSHLKYSDGSKKCRKSFKYYKPYWNEELSRLWKSMNEKEKGFRQYLGNCKHVKSRFAMDFKASRSVFDKALRKAERSYRRELCNEIDNVCIKNPNDFWKSIKKLGPRSIRKYMIMNVMITLSSLMNKLSWIIGRMSSVNCMIFLSTNFTLMTTLEVSFWTKNNG